MFKSVSVVPLVLAVLLACNNRNLGRTKRSASLIRLQSSVQCVNISYATLYRFLSLILRNKPTILQSKCGSKRMIWRHTPNQEIDFIVK